MPETNQARRLLERQALGYRDQAEEFRTVCEGTRNEMARGALLRLADTADRKAAQIEAQLQRLRVA